MFFIPPAASRADLSRETAEELGVEALFCGQGWSDSRRGKARTRTQISELWIVPEETDTVLDPYTFCL